jgi:hypothetical protein
MKIKDLLKSFANVSGNQTICLKHKDLTQIKDFILACDEFKNVKELEIVEKSYIEENEKNKTTMLYHVTKDSIFTGKLFLYSLELGSEVFDSSEVFNPVKDGCSIFTFYNSEKFEQYKKFCMEISLEKLQDSVADPNKTYKKELISKFENMLDCPEDYRVKGDRSVILRGIVC